MKNHKTVPNNLFHTLFPQNEISQSFLDSLTGSFAGGGLVGDGYYPLFQRKKGLDRDDNRDVNNTLPLLAIAANRNEAAKYQDVSPRNQGNNSHLFKTLSDDNRDVDLLPLFAVDAKWNKPQPQWRALTDAGLIIDVKASEVVEDKQDTAVIGDVPESQGTGDTVISRTIVEVSKNPETLLDESKLKDNLKVVFADTLQNNSELDLLEIYGIVDTALRDSYDYLSKFRFDPDYSQKLETAFGSDFNREVADNLFDNFADKNFTDIPTIKIVNRGAIAGGNGAFSDNTQKVYLALEFVNKYANNTARITDVLIEEIGHFVESQINTIDAPGDEGDIFSELVLGNTISDEALKALKAENDKVTLVRGNNEEIGIERNNNINTLRVGTWNLYRGDAPNIDGIVANNHTDRIKIIADVARHNDIDVMVLQEFNPKKLSPNVVWDNGDDSITAEDIRNPVLQLINPINLNNGQRDNFWNVQVVIQEYPYLLNRDFQEIKYTITENDNHYRRERGQGLLTATPALSNTQDKSPLSLDEQWSLAM